MIATNDGTMNSGHIEDFWCVMASELPPKNSLLKVTYN